MMKVVDVVVSNIVVMAYFYPCLPPSLKSFIFKKIIGMFI